MTNELRKMLGRNMRFAQMNNDIDNQIKQYGYKYFRNAEEDE